MSVQVDEYAGLDPMSLTKKQADVLNGLRGGKTINQIARQMKITPPGVYAHIRALNKHAANGSAPASSNGDGHAESNGVEPISGGFEVAVEKVRQSLREEQESLTESEGRLAQSEEQIATAQRMINEAQQTIAAEGDEIARRAARVEALEAAYDSLSMVAV